MQEKIVGLDLDGVIIDHSGLKLSLAKQFGFDLKPHETHSEILSQRIKDPALRSIKNALYNDPTTARSQPLMPGAREGLAKLASSGIPFYLISRRRSDEGRANATELLKIHGLWPTYFSEKNVHYVDEGMGKNPVAQKLGVTHFMDDEFKILQTLSDVKHTFLFDQFGNFHEQASHTGVSSWGEFLSHVI
jgi:hypothetical protein